MGSILGGYFAAWLGLKRALLPLILVMNLPMLTYFYLSTEMPTSTVLITLAMSLEMFGYGFGFVGVMLVMMQEIAPGKYQTAHYAFANSLMKLGLILPGAMSGWIQMKIGYEHFFCLGTDFGRAGDDSGAICADSWPAGGGQPRVCEV